MNPIPSFNTPIIDDQRRWTAVWLAYMSSIHDFLGPVGTHGITAHRPIDSSQNPLYIGQMFFDDTLGKPVYVKSRAPTVWVDGSGAVV